VAEARVRDGSVGQHCGLGGFNRRVEDLIGMAAVVIRPVFLPFVAFFRVHFVSLRGGEKHSARGRTASA
jgi:hypothetical protein